MSSFKGRSKRTRLYAAAHDRLFQMNSHPKELVWYSEAQLLYSLLPELICLVEEAWLVSPEEESNTGLLSALETLVKKIATEVIDD